MMGGNVTAVCWSIMSITILLDIILCIDLHLLQKSELHKVEIEIEPYVSRINSDFNSLWAVTNSDAILWKKSSLLLQFAYTKYCVHGCVSIRWHVSPLACNSSFAPVEGTPHIMDGFVGINWNIAGCVLVLFVPCFNSIMFFRDSILNSIWRPTHPY